MTCTLYLVSAEVDGAFYWKIGITRHKNPIKRNPKQYREVFRAVEFGDVLWTADDLDKYRELFPGCDYTDARPGDVESSANDEAAFREGTLREAIRQLDCPVGYEWIDGKASIESVCNLFDQVVAWYEEDFCHPALSGNLWAVKHEQDLRQRAKETHSSDLGKAAEYFAEMLPAWERQQTLLNAIRRDIACVAKRSEPVPMWA